MENEKQINECIELLKDVLDRPFVLIFPQNDCEICDEKVNAFCYTTEVNYSIHLIKTALNGIKDSLNEHPKFSNN